MITSFAAVLALLPLVLVLALAIHDLGPWWRDHARIRALPERPDCGLENKGHV
jgi:hypothetical protein